MPTIEIAQTRWVDRRFGLPLAVPETSHGRVQNQPPLGPEGDIYHQPANRVAAAGTTAGN
jgi:hypothetical protein